jgi:hypothetical protein
VNAELDRDEIGTVADLVPTKQLATIIRTSAEHVLAMAFSREGIIASPEKIARIAKEIGNNAASIVGVTEVG